MRWIGTLRDDFGAILEGDRTQLLELEDIALLQLVRRHGVAVFRGRGATIEDFERFSAKSAGTFFVQHGTGRRFVDPGGTVASVAPGSSAIPPHVERGYAPPVPDLLFFYCKTAPSPACRGGATTVYDGFQLFSAMSASLQRHFVDARLRWRTWVPHEMLAQIFDGDAHLQPDHIVNFYQDKLANPRYQERIEATFMDGGLRVDFVAPAAIRAPRKDGWAFSNSGLSYLGSWMRDEEIELLSEDRRPYPTEFLSGALEYANHVVVRIEWQAGDIVAIDNRTVLHGREAFDDPGREVYVRMCFADV
ncbi:TauD/TfdA family dioxygenase [Roseateles sp. SL47]|uniref:TauD/TfdA dioxygenase family protein n=1 Tax=Roseateles sp. SL47 TaxID=2995138 RepID=UPI0022700C92|nr:TauD/TfdA family dioxygenase [Roseateles sp. SL47]WAC73511.1 TauD/TfdA family dioxygenase [Roseateles sp. SL47]